MNWVIQQRHEAMSFGLQPRYLFRDNNVLAALKQIILKNFEFAADSTMCNIYFAVNVRCLSWWRAIPFDA